MYARHYTLYTDHGKTAFYNPVSLGEVNQVHIEANVCFTPQHTKTNGVPMNGPSLLRSNLGHNVSRANKDYILKALLSHLVKLPWSLH